MTNKIQRAFFGQQPHFSVIFLMFWALAFYCVPNYAADDHPLKPIDTSSPRATLQGFLEQMNKAYATGVGMVDAYLATSKQYLSSENIASLKVTLHHQKLARRALDLSELPLDLSQETSMRLGVQLNEVLDRLDLPNLDSIPDAQAMAKSEFKYWVIPKYEFSGSKKDLELVNTCLRQRPWTACRNFMKVSKACPTNPVPALAGMTSSRIARRALL